MQVTRLLCFFFTLDIETEEQIKFIKQENHLTCSFQKVIWALAFRGF